MQSAAKTDRIVQTEFGAVGVRSSFDVQPFKAEMAGSLPIVVNSTGANGVFFPDSPGAIAFATVEHAQQAAAALNGES